MDGIAVLREQFGRVPETLRHAVEGLSRDELLAAPATGANPIGWLGWHIARGIDAQIAELSGSEQVYLTGAWAERFDRDPDPADTGYGHSRDEVRAVRPESSDAVLGYLDAAHAAAMAYLDSIRDAALDDVIDESWDPPVTRGVRLVSIADDAVQHAGQAAYVRGLLGH